MVDVQVLKQFLKEEYNITNLLELEKAIEKTEPIDIGIFVSPKTEIFEMEGNVVGEEFKNIQKEGINV